MRIYHHDQAGFYLGASDADPSPLEPGKFLVPARAVTTPPPDDLPEDHVPRWNGAEWKAVRRPLPPEAEDDPLAKLRAFLNANPDVADLIR